MLSLFCLGVGGRVSIFGRDAKPQRPALHAKGKISSRAHSGFFKLFVPLFRFVPTISIDSWLVYINKNSWQYEKKIGFLL